MFCVVLLGLMSQALVGCGNTSPDAFDTRGQGVQQLITRINELNARLHRIDDINGANANDEAIQALVDDLEAIQNRFDALPIASETEREQLIRAMQQADTSAKAETLLARWQSLTRDAEMARYLRDPMLRYQQVMQRMDPTGQLLAQRPADDASGNNPTNAPVTRPSTRETRMPRDTSRPPDTLSPSPAGVAKPPRYVLRQTPATEVTGLTKAFGTYDWRVDLLWVLTDGQLVDLLEHHEALMRNAMIDEETRRIEQAGATPITRELIRLVLDRNDATQYDRLAEHARERGITIPDSFRETRRELMRSLNEREIDARRQALSRFEHVQQTLGTTEGADWLRQDNDPPPMLKGDLARTPSWQDTLLADDAAVVMMREDRAAQEAVRESFRSRSAADEATQRRLESLRRRFDRERVLEVRFVDMPLSIREDHVRDFAQRVPGVEMGAVWRDGRDPVWNLVIAPVDNAQAFIDAMPFTTQYQYDPFTRRLIVDGRAMQAR